MCRHKHWVFAFGEYALWAGWGRAEAMSTQRILGIDRGLRATGFGVIEPAGRWLGYLTGGVIHAGTGTLPARLTVILSRFAHRDSIRCSRGSNKLPARHDSRSKCPL